MSSTDASDPAMAASSSAVGGGFDFDSCGIRRAKASTTSGVTPSAPTTSLTSTSTLLDLGDVGDMADTVDAVPHRPDQASRQNWAMLAAVSRLMSGQASENTSVPWMVPITCRHRAGTPARSSVR